MNVVKINSLHELKKLLKEVKNVSEYEFLVVSEIIKRDNFPNKTRVSLCSFMIPDPNTLNLYLDNGDKIAYAKNYFKHLSRPEMLFIINTIIKRCFANNSTMCLVCAADDNEYGYISLLGEFIEMNYGIKPLSIKKFLSGKKSKCKVDGDAFEQIIEKRQQILYNKLNDMRISPVDILISIMHPKDLKKQDPIIRQRAKRYYEKILED